MGFNQESLQYNQPCRISLYPKRSSWWSSWDICGYYLMWWSFCNLNHCTNGALVSFGQISSTHQSYVNFSGNPFSLHSWNFYSRRVVMPLGWPIQPYWILHTWILYRSYINKWNPCSKMDQSTSVESQYTPPFWYVCLLCCSKLLVRLLEYHQLLHHGLTTRQSCIT